MAPDPNDVVFKASPGSYASELHERFASPLYAFAFVLVVLAFMGQARTTRTSRLQSVIGAFGVAVLSRIGGITCANMVAVRPAMAPLLYAVPAVTALLAAFVIQWHVYPRRPSRLARALASLFEAARNSLAAARWRLLPARAATRARG
jgi:lipopolysaccharide export system permease protein